MSVTPPREGVNIPGAQYDVRALDTWVGGLGHNGLDTRTRQFVAGSENIGETGLEISGYPLLDWWPVPTADKKFAIYGARNWKTGGASGMTDIRLPTR
jgi:hypothetical protein